MAIRSKLRRCRSIRRFIPRCGTSFLMTVMIISIFVYMLVPVHTFWARFAIRIALLPVITGVAYEIIRFAAKHRSSLVRGDDGAGPLAAANHHASADGRASAMRDSCARSGDGSGKRARRRTGNCLAGPPPKNLSRSPSNSNKIYETTGH